jgi:hypothetical protein
MRPLLNGGTLIWNDGSSSKGGFSSFSRSFVALVAEVEVNESAAEVGRISTVDHADIRGSARPPSWSSFVGSCLALGSRILRRIAYPRVLLRRPARPLTRSLRLVLRRAMRLVPSHVELLAEHPMEGFHQKVSRIKSRSATLLSFDTRGEAGGAGTWSHGF